MPFPPHEVLGAIADHVPASLVPGAARLAVEGFARRLPPAFNWLGYECRLGAGDERVDFAGCCEAWNGGRDALITAIAAAPDLTGPGPTALVHEWHRPGSLLTRHCPAVWLEFDFLGRHAPVPFAFLCIDPGCENTFHRRPRAPRPLPLDLLLALIERGARLLAGPADIDGALALVRRCAAALPASGRALHVAATPHRGHDDLRLHFALFSCDLLAWLDRISWPGDRAEVARALQLFGDDFRQVGVQLAIGDALRPTLGLEVYVSGGPATLPAWSRSLAALAEAGVCDRGKADALLAWWGKEVVRLACTPWPVLLERQFYLKLALAPGELVAKGYLAAFPSYTI